MNKEYLSELKRLVEANNANETAGQFGMVTEEMGELLQARNKLLRTRKWSFDEIGAETKAVDHVIEEAMDVVVTTLGYLMGEEVGVSIDEIEDLLDNHMRYKVQRAFKKIEAAKNV